MDTPMDTPMVEMSKWEQFQASFDLFRDPILCALIAGGVLGFLSVYVVTAALTKTMRRSTT